MSLQVQFLNQVGRIGERQICVLSIRVSVGAYIFI